MRRIIIRFQHHHMYIMLFSETNVNRRTRRKFAILIYMDTEILLKHTSRSLYLSVQALPRAMRPAFSVAYLLCRYADTIADTHLLPAERRLYWIERFPGMIHSQNPQEATQLAREISGGSENPYEEQLIKHLIPCLNWFNQIPAPQQTIIMEVVQAVCEGMRMDLSTFPTREGAAPIALKTPDELEHYCRLMGGMPGLFWSKLIYHTQRVAMPEEQFYELGQHVGDALQIVNILRDLPKDLPMGRCYFPQTDLEQAGLTPTELLSSSNSARFEPVKRQWIVWGLRRLASAKPYFRQLSRLHPGQRAAVAWPVLWTADTLYKVYEEKELLNSQKRVKISRNVIYSTMLLSPLVLVSNTAFCAWLDHKINRFSR